jgi:hypothetical protein
VPLLHTFFLCTGFFRSKKEPTEKDKEKENKKKSKKDKTKDAPRELTNTPSIAEDAKSESSFGSQPYDQSNASTVPQLDAEGYVIRPDGGPVDSKLRSDSYEQCNSDSDSGEPP